MPNMKQKISDSIKTLLRNEFTRSATGSLSYRQGQSLYLNGQCSLLSESGNHYRFSVDDKYGDFQVEIFYTDELKAACSCKSELLCRHKTAALLQLDEIFRLGEDELPSEGIKYTRKGMIQRVIEERKKKALQANYSVEFADNIYGEHLLTNDRGVVYRITLRDLERRHGYCNCPDYKNNKLGTCKHLIYVFLQLKEHPSLIPSQLPPYPFIEVFLNPFRNNKISYFYPEKMTGPLAELFYRYFGNRNFIEDEEDESFTGFLNNTEKFKQILVRPEVIDKVKKAAEQASILRLKQTRKLNFSLLKTNLPTFQMEGAEFATFRTGAILADDIELGRIQQATAAAILKRDIFGFTKSLIICPANLKQQWKREIEQLSGEQPLLIEGTTEQRQKLYQTGSHYFQIVNYENVLHDQKILAENNPDFIILDEAQRIKNYESAISSAIRSLPRRHTLLLAGGPFDSNIIELYAMVLLVDESLLSPLWEFSYKYCYFDDHGKNNIVGYYDLDELNLRLEKILLRRRKDEVIKQLPQISNIDVPVDMHPYQIKLHLKYARELIGILSKKVINPFELQLALQLIRKLRMLADSTFLVDDLTNISPKIDEVKSILTEKLNLRKSRKKIILFTEWKKMIQILGRMLRVNRIKYIEITDETPEKQQKLLIKNFDQDENCNVMLCGNVGLIDAGIKKAEVIINFDAPAERETKSLRMGNLTDILRHRGNLTIINLYAKNSLEEKINAGLELDLSQKEKKNPQGESGLKFSKVLLAELSNAIKETSTRLLQQINEESVQSKNTESSQMVFNFDLEEPVKPDLQKNSEFQSRNIKPMSDNKLKINPDRMNQLLAGSSAVFSQIIKISTGEEIDVVDYTPEYDPVSGEIVLRFKIISGE